MRHRAYYNEHDAFCCAWLSNLMDAGLIMPGRIDDRSIEDVLPSDLDGVVRAHFFAGIGGWDLALQLAGWPEEKPVFSGSCPCQPFSSAGKGKGAADERHLWPAFFHLIRECRPPVVFGEQVGAAIGHGWLDLISNDLEGEGYACGAAVFPACGVGAFHIRQRLYWVAESTQQQHDRTWVARPGRRAEHPDGGPTGGLAFPHDAQRRAEIPGGHDGHGPDTGWQKGPGDAQGCGRTDRNPWSTAVWLPCRDGKARPAPAPPTQRGLQLILDGLPARLGAVWDGLSSEEKEAVKQSCLGFPLAGKLPNRVGLLRGAGNAIVPQQAAAFIQAVMECQP